jgi:hypothetical protein
LSRDRNVRAHELSGIVSTASALDITGRAAGNTVGLSSRDRNGCAPKLSGIFGVASTLDINGRAVGNTVILSSWDGNSHAPELSGTADALDIISRVEGHGYHVRPARPLRHSTHYTPASGGDGYGRAPELSGTVEAVGTLDINGRAASNATGLWSRDENDRAPELSRTVQVEGALDINGGVEGHGCHVRPTQPLRHSTHFMPASCGDSETGEGSDGD